MFPVRMWRVPTGPRIEPAAIGLGSTFRQRLARNLAPCAERLASISAYGRLGVHAGTDRIDTVKLVAAGLLRTSASPSDRKSLQRLRAIKRIRHHRRTEARLDLVDIPDQTPSGLVGSHPILALDRIVAQSGPCEAISSLVDRKAVQQQPGRTARCRGLDKTDHGCRLSDVVLRMMDR